MHFKNGRTIMDYDSAQYYKGSIIPELMFKQQWFWTLILLIYIYICMYMQCMIMYIYIYISYRPLKILIVLSPCSLLSTKTHVDSSPAVFLSAAQWRSVPVSERCKIWKKPWPAYVSTLRGAKGPSCTFGRALPKDRCKLVVVGLCWLTSRL